MSDILRNPILIGVLAAALVYTYLYWEEDKRHKKNPKIKREQTSFITPAVVGVIVWFLASSYFSSEESSTIPVCDLTKQPFATNPLPVNLPPEYCLVNGKPNTAVPGHTVSNIVPNSNVGAGTDPTAIAKPKPPISVPETMRLVGKNNIRLPPTDVFIDLAKF